MCFQAFTPLEVFERLVVDDGQPSRGQRKNVFNQDLTFCGVAAGEHLTQGNVVLIE